MGETEGWLRALRYACVCELNLARAGQLVSGACQVHLRRLCLWQKKQAQLLANRAG